MLQLTFVWTVVHKRPTASRVKNRDSCRVGSVELREILERIIGGKGEPEDLQRLDLVCKAMQDAPYCDFARTTSNPVVTILKHFRSEFEKHVDQKVCPAGVCEGLAKEIGGQSG